MKQKVSLTWQQQKQLEIDIIYFPLLNMKNHSSQITFVYKDHFNDIGLLGVWFLWHINTSLSSFLHTIKWFQVLLYNSHNLTSGICLHTVCSIWSIDRTLSGTTTPGQSEPGSNCNEEVLHIL